MELLVNSFSECKKDYLFSRFSNTFDAMETNIDFLLNLLKMEKLDYTPEFGDLFLWAKHEYFCIANNGRTGIVKPKDDNFVIKNFKFNFDMETPIFVRKPTSSELFELHNILAELEKSKLKHTL